MGCDTVRWKLEWVDWRKIIDKTRLCSLSVKSISFALVCNGFCGYFVIQNKYVGIYYTHKIKYRYFDLYMRPYSSTIWLSIVLISITASIVFSI